MEPIILKRKPINGFEKAIWNTPLWRIYEYFGADKKKIVFNPFKMAFGEIVIHMNFINSVESKFPKINEDWFILAATQNPGLFIGILCNVISSENPEELKSWMIKYSSPSDLAEAYRVFRNSVLAMSKNVEV